MDEAVEHLSDESRLFPPIEIELGDVQLFPVSNVVFINLARGEESIRALHALLDTGALHFRCPFEFHPHITIAQDLAPEEVESALLKAREAWAAYRGPRRFVVDSMSFVQNVAPYLWLDLACVHLASPVEAVA